MEVPMRKCLCIFMCLLAASATSFRSVSSSSTSGRDFRTFLFDLNSQCPLSLPPPSPPIQVDGKSFELALSSIRKHEYIAVLFYASWCPFSNIFQSTFSNLSSMSPRIKHLMVEQTSVLPSVFSRYGIHTVPSLLIVNQTTKTRYHGPKDLPSLVNFYQKTTGYPVVYLSKDATSSSKTDEKTFNPWNGATLKEIFLREPYLVLSAIFVFSRASLYFFPGIASHIIAMWAAYIPHMSMGVFGESRQLMGRILHLVDIKRIWSKLKLCKTRSFHKGARNARVWALFPPRDL